MKYSHFSVSGSAATMMCPFKLAQKWPLKSILFLAAGSMVILIDCAFSKRILGVSLTNEPAFVILLAISGFAILKDVVSTKKSFSTSQTFVLLRFSSIAGCMLLTAAGVFLAPIEIKYQIYTILICSAFRLFTPSEKHFYVPLVFGTIALIAAIIVMKYFYAGSNTAEIDINRIYPVCSTLIIKIKDFIVSRW